MKDKETLSEISKIIGVDYTPAKKEDFFKDLKHYDADDSLKRKRANTLTKKL
jgi:hypothetical protein